MKKIINDIYFDITHPTYEIISIYLKYIYRWLLAKITKKVNLSSEAWFWERFYYYTISVSGNLINWGDSKKTKDRYSIEMKKLLEILIEEFNEEIKLIDVGSGPITSFFSYLDINAWNIVTVDPLAKLYNYLNKKYEINYPLECTEGMGENLDNLFNKESFHLVLSRNAIDHAVSPHKFINNLFHILKPKGYLYLAGFINEGKKQNYTGLHQHNLYIENDCLIWTNKDNFINLNLIKNLDVTLIYKDVQGVEPGDTFKLIYKKN